MVEKYQQDTVLTQPVFTAYAADGVNSTDGFDSSCYQEVSAHFHLNTPADWDAFDNLSVTVFESTDRVTWTQLEEQYIDFTVGTAGEVRTNIQCLNDPSNESMLASAVPCKKYMKFAFNVTIGGVPQVGTLVTVGTVKMSPWYSSEISQSCEYTPATLICNESA